MLIKRFCCWTKKRRKNQLPPLFTSTAPTSLAAVLAGLRRTLWIILEVTAALLPALLSGFRCTFGILGEVTFATTMFSHVSSPVSFRCEVRSEPRYGAHYE